MNNAIVLAQATLTIPMGSAFAHTSEHPVDMQLLGRTVQEILQSNADCRLHLQPNLVVGATVNSLYVEDTVTVTATHLTTASCSFETWSKCFEDLIRCLLSTFDGAEDAIVFYNGEGKFIGI